jgi:hypothetical protein
MSLLHPTDEDNAFADGHAKTGWNKAIRRAMRLRKLLERARSDVKDNILAVEIDTALSKTFYDESDEFPPTGWERKT